MPTLSAIAQSGLQAAQVRLDTAAHNVANGQTPGFRRQTVQAQAQPAGPGNGGSGVVVNLSQAAQEGSDLAQDVVDQVAARQSFAANLAVLKTSDKMLGSLLDTRA
jgi:flagellar hook protein FlgE